VTDVATRGGLPPPRGELDIRGQQERPDHVPPPKTKSPDGANRSGLLWRSCRKVRRRLRRASQALSGRLTERVPLPYRTRAHNLAGRQCSSADAKALAPTERSTQSCVRRSWRARCCRICDDSWAREYTLVGSAVNCKRESRDDRHIGSVCRLGQWLAAGDAARKVS
jgi:hypothetical protein